MFVNAFTILICGLHFLFTGGKNNCLENCFCKIKKFSVLIVEHCYDFWNVSTSLCFRDKREEPKKLSEEEMREISNKENAK